ncbi:MAG: hypothetical protein HY514_04255 [Candidatus Aenigmarchaeota archaeon]|nr:hypothetical protein [Candidatus Aenigmarchaeota archaeon]
MPSAVEQAPNSEFQMPISVQFEIPAATENPELSTYLALIRGSPSPHAHLLNRVPSSPQEIETIEYLNTRGIDWRYEERKFNFTPTERGDTLAFIPDLYFPDYNSFLEITRGQPTAKKHDKMALMARFYPGVKASLMACEDEARQIFFDYRANKGKVIARMVKSSMQDDPEVLARYIKTGRFDESLRQYTFRFPSENSKKRAMCISIPELTLAVA